MNDRIEKDVKDFIVKNYGERYVDATLSKSELPAYAQEIILQYMENPKNMLIFLSTPGLGKTYTLAAMTDWAFHKFPSRRYHREGDLLKRLRIGISNGVGDYIQNLHYFIDDDLIMLDDIGSGINPDKESYRDLEFRREVFFEFLDYRYNRRKPTIITSNFSHGDFQKVYSERICSRLFATENTLIKIFDQPDKRSLGM